MKKFLKQITATILGLAIFTGFCIFCMFIVFGLISNLSNSSPFIQTIKPDSILHIKLEGKLVAHNNLLIRRFKQEVGLSYVANALTKAKKDPNIVGVYLEIKNNFLAEEADLNTLKHELEKFKECKKPIVAYASKYTDSTLALASSTDHIILTSTGNVLLKGVSISALFFKDTLEYFGITPICSRTGKYKSLGEPYTRNSMSEENKEQLNGIINTLHNQYTSTIMKDRKVSKEKLEEIYNNSPLLSPSEALEHNLIDKVGDKNAVEEYFNALLNKAENIDTKEEQEYNYITVNEYYDFEEAADTNKPQIVVLSLKGVIVLGKSKKGEIGSETVTEVLKSYAKDPKCKGIVIQIDSPGGDVIASNHIRNAIIETQTQKPVSVSMTNVAASGGYYIATPCKIVAQRETITGSIGVVSLRFCINKGLKDWLHINVETLKTHPLADIYSRYRTPTKKGAAIIQHHIDHLYDCFLDHVAKGRNMSKEQVEEIAGGRVWMAEDALEKGLIDKIGYLQDAIDIAAKQANMVDGEYTVMHHNPFLTLRELIEFFSDYFSEESSIQQLHPHLKYLKHLEERKGTQAYWPYKIMVEKI